MNTYTGTTLVSGGTLILSGSGSIAGSSRVNVASGSTQTLSGNGTIVGYTILQGTLAAGNSPGILTFDDDLMFTSTANSIFEIESGAPVRGTTYDGTLTLTMTTLIGNGTYDLFYFDSGTFAGSFDSAVAPTREGLPKMEVISTTRPATGKSSASDCTAAT